MFLSMVFFASNMFCEYGLLEKAIWEYGLLRKAMLCFVAFGKLSFVSVAFLGRLFL